jgi:hypothetical protein
MWDGSAIAERVISEYHAIRWHIKLAGDTVNDMEAFFTKASIFFPRQLKNMHSMKKLFQI